MGLSGNKKRIKLSQDPNNTTWSKDTTNYGHRILAQQGWTPGQYLGAENASHAEHYSAANSSHIRVLLREDNLGLGAKLGGKANADTFGLSTLSGIFGRLNGKSEEVVQKQQGALRDAELRGYQAQKYGFMNFVSGGLLVGDKMEENMLSEVSAGSKTTTPENESGASKKRKAETSTSEGVVGKLTKSKKRKSTSVDPVLFGSEADLKQDVSARHAHGSSTVQDEEAEEGAKDKQSKKKRRKSEWEDGPSEEDALEKARLKQEKRERKIERRKKKEAKRLKREAASKTTTAALPILATTASSSDDDSDVPTPAPRPTFAGSRHAVRQRYIQQKRLASMDPKALKEILMITAQT